MAFVVLLTATSNLFASAPAANADSISRFDGTWVADDAQGRNNSALDMVWESVFTVNHGAFSVTHFCGSSQTLTGILALDPASPGAIDLHVDPIDVSDVWEGINYPHYTVPAIYKFQDGKLTLCVCPGSKTRPVEFAANTRQTFLLTLAPANRDFKKFPAKVSVTVLDAAGKPVRGASVFSQMIFWQKPTTTQATHWVYDTTATAGPDGVAAVPYDSLTSHPLAASNAEHDQVAVAAMSPSILQSGSVTITLQPVCHVHATIVSTSLATAGQPVGGTIAYLNVAGQHWGIGDSFTGTFEFSVPPGRYTLNTYGEQLRQRYLDITVPAGQHDLTLPPIDLIASNLALLTGRPAPELADIVAWTPQQVKFADLRGQYVLLDFWGYWCGPCIAQMPNLISLSEEFKGKGLVVIGVHLDEDGEITTPEQLDRKLSTIKQKYWNGKDLPFPVALANGTPRDLPNGDSQRGGPAEEYGIMSYPTTVLIDRKGNVVGQFYAHNLKAAREKIEALLAGTK